LLVISFKSNCWIQDQRQGIFCGPDLGQSCKLSVFSATNDYIYTKSMLQINLPT